ncbi:MAG TPA: right-handed parallel beta-helix repeat-containing protein [Actinomycetes bacterium]|nr:right-handed parallel beta-helix repeat-containing protein [Actinomycetes bacterium]
MFRDRHFFRSGRFHSFGSEGFALLDVALVALSETTAQVRWTMSAVCSGQVEYGLTDSYGSTTTEAPITDGTAQHLQLITGLTAGTTYHYRTKSTNATGSTIYSDDQSFTTDADTGITYTDYTVTVGITTISGLQAYLATVPDGADTTHHSRVLLGAGRTYTGSSGLNVSGRSHLTFEGGGAEVAWGNTGGATIATTGVASSTSSMAIRDPEGQTPADDLVFHAINILGTSTVYATTNAGTGTAEYQAAFGLYGSSNIVIDRCMADKVQGDFVYLTSLNGSSGGTWCSNITISDSTCSNNGRMGVAIIAADTVLIDTCRFTDICYAPFDFEPNAATQGMADVEMRDCLIDGQYFSWDNSYDDGCFVTANASLTGVTITGYLRFIDNTVTASMYPYQSSDSWDGHFRLRYPASVVKTATLTITGNTCTAPKQPVAVITQGWVNGGTITNNTGFLSSGTNDDFWDTAGGDGSFTVTGNS